VIKILIVTAALLSPVFAFGYPDFISYGYKSCITCHFNGAGGGALTDYGRSLFATEFTASDSKSTDEELSNKSGFLGSTEIPWWIRPGFKFRGMFLKTRLEDDKNSTSRFIPMQLSFNTAILFDEKADKIFVGSLDYVPTPTRFGTTNEKKPLSWVAKDYYFRWVMTKGWIIYAGLMDKTYGIRQPDHTAFSRGFNGFGLNQNDQSHGLILQMNFEKIEMFLNAFVGNLNQDEPLRQKGFSFMGEYALSKESTLGLSFMKSANQYLDISRMGVHSRVGFAKGKSLMAEVGLRTDKPLTITAETQNGLYSYIESLIAFTKGYNFLSTYQIYNEGLDSTATVHNKLGLGFLMFPWQKTEFRTELINDRTVADQSSVPDTWTAEAQVHISW
jgi:hypothetical protein